MGLDSEGRAPVFPDGFPSGVTVRGGIAVSGWNWVDVILAGG